MLGLVQLGEISTAWYCERIESLAPGLDYQKVDCDFAKLNAFLPDNYTKQEPLLGRLIDLAKQRGITQLLLPNITLHHSFYLNPAWRRGVKLFDPFDFLSGARRGQQVIVLGTRHTQESAVLKQRLKENGLILRSLDASTCARVDALRLAIYQHGYTTAAAATLNAVIAGLNKEAAVLVACTELSAALRTDNPAVIDLAMLQIKAFVDELTGTG